MGRAILASQPTLTIVQPAGTGAEPPRALGKAGRALWNAVQAEYDVSDIAGIELLAQACSALSAAEALREEIERDGAVLRDRRGMIKDHPALKHELANRAFVVRTLTKLRLELRAVAHRRWASARSAMTSKRTTFTRDPRKPITPEVLQLFDRCLQL